MPMFVRLVNTDDKPFDFHHANVKRIIPAGKDTIVPWELATTLFGDPYAFDTPRAKDRQRAIAQARGNFGYMDGGETSEAFDARRPHIEVWDVETSPPERVYMLIEDPEGELTNPVNTEAAMGGDMMAVMEQRIAALTRMVEQMAQAQMYTQPSRPDGQTVIPSFDAPSSTTGSMVGDSSFGFAYNPAAGQVTPPYDPATLTPTQVSQAAAYQAYLDSLQVQQAGTGEGLMAQFASTTPGSMPADDDITPTPPLEAMGEQVVPIETPDHVAPGQTATPSASVDAPPATLAPRPTRQSK